MKTPADTGPKKQTAIITLVRNEPYFLPRWLEYYGRTGASLFVLDHESDDGSTANLPPGVSRIPVHHPDCEPAAWMMRTVQDQMRELFGSGYERCIYAEVDEFLVPDPARWPNLRTFLDAHDDDFIAAQGWNVMYRPGDLPLPKNWMGGDGINYCKEYALHPGAVSMLAGRGWKREPIYDMTLIGSWVPNWKIGRHGMEDRPNGPDVGLRLVHLHYADPELGWARIQARVKGRTFAPDGMGFQNKPESRKEFDEHWGGQCRDAEPIPEAYWNVI